MQRDASGYDEDDDVTTPFVQEADARARFRPIGPFDEACKCNTVSEWNDPRNGASFFLSLIPGCFFPSPLSPPPAPGVEGDCRRLPRTRARATPSVRPPPASRAANGRRPPRHSACLSLRGKMALRARGTRARRGFQRLTRARARASSAKLRGGTNSGQNAASISYFCSQLIERK